MAVRHRTLLLLGAASLCATSVVAGSALLDLRLRGPIGDGAIAASVGARDVLAVALPPDAPADAIEVAFAAPAEPADEARGAERPPTFSYPPGTFQLRHALLDPDRAAEIGFAELPAPALDGADGRPDEAVGEGSLPVRALPPRRPDGLDAAGAALTIIAVRPPARPDFGAVRLASIDVARDSVASDAPPAAIAVAPPPPAAGLSGLLGSLGRSFARNPGVGGETGPDGGKPQSGLASWYGPGFHGRKTASGERFNQHDLTAAHRTLPFGTRVKVIDESTGRSVVVRINDRGPFIRGRIIDLSRGSAQALGMLSTKPVKIVSAE